MQFYVQLKDNLPGIYFSGTAALTNLSEQGLEHRKGARTRANFLSTSMKDADAGRKDVY